MDFRYFVWNVEFFSPAIVYRVKGSNLDAKETAPVLCGGRAENHPHPKEEP